MISPRAWIGVFFECCCVYVQVFRRPEVDRYRVRCPRCLRTTDVRVGPEGSDARFFRAR